jgi:hypothetical protein
MVFSPKIRLAEGIFWVGAFESSVSSKLVSITGWTQLYATGITTSGSLFD